MQGRRQVRCRGGAHQRRQLARTRLGEQDSGGAGTKNERPLATSFSLASTSKLVVSTYILLSLCLFALLISRPLFVHTAYLILHTPHTHCITLHAHHCTHTHTHTHRGGETVQSRLQPRRGVADRVDQAAQAVLPQDHSTTSRLWSSLCEGGDKMHSIVKTSGNVRLPRGWRRREQTAVHLTCLQLENNTTPIHCIIFFVWSSLCMRFVAFWKRKGGKGRVRYL